MSDFSDHMAATYRYPGVEFWMALEMLHSDRRCAGLGALGSRGKHRRSVRRMKYVDILDSGRLIYQWDSTPSGRRHLRMCIAFEKFDRDDRAFMAHRLRRARREWQIALIREYPR